MFTFLGGVSTRTACSLQDAKVHQLARGETCLTELQFDDFLLLLEACYNIDEHKNFLKPSVRVRHYPTENYSNGLRFDTRGPDTKGVEIASLSTEVAAQTPREWDRGRRERGVSSRSNALSLQHTNEPRRSCCDSQPSCDLIGNGAKCLSSSRRCERLRSYLRQVTSSAMH